MIRAGFMLAAGAALALGGCAVTSPDGKVATGSLRTRSDTAAAAPAKSKDETLKAFCAQRHVDYQDGKAPGGATSLEKKKADDRLCEAIGRQG
jgi:hypothetical protein